MSRLSILLAAAALSLPLAAYADTPAPASDAAFGAFQSVCSSTGAAYDKVAAAATAGGWVDTAMPAEDEAANVSITGKMARSKADQGVSLTLLATQGVQHASDGDVTITTCEISSNKADEGVRALAQAWLGFAPDSQDQGLDVYYVKPGAKPAHVAKADIGKALASGGVGVLKVQQDPDGVILKLQTFSK